MLAYYANLISLAFRDIPGSLGSNWLGLIFPAITVFVGECIACFAYGWRTMIAKWKQATLVGLASLVLCYLALFTWGIAVQNYTGYSSLSMANSSLKELVATASEKERFAVLQAQKECAKTIGKNENLERQNKDQQSTINSCLNQALSFIKPPQLHIDPIKSKYPPAVPGAFLCEPLEAA